ncbi:MAG: serine/threonine-protein kinase [Snowella sp.]|nr:serine/threonine-protein kinase [Snowella sp.]
MFAAPLWGMLEGQVIKDQYYLQQVLGAGTFGGVFLTDQVVRDTTLRTLATKVIFINQPELVSYQLRELQVALSFDHPNLIKCHDAGEAKIEKPSISFLYLLMELAEETLDNRLAKKSFSREEIKNIVKDITTGLAYLHQKEHIHLDLKPANILRVQNHWKIGDYGLVRGLDPQRSYMETMNFSLGTKAYSPPESYQGIISSDWDMWSLGIIVVMLLTDKYPIRFETSQELDDKIKTGQFDNINWNDLEQPWRKIAQGCLQVDRQQRWTAKQVLSELNTENPSVLTITLPCGVELEMIKIPAGSFLMGSSEAGVPT